MKQIKLSNSNKVVLVDDRDYAELSRFSWGINSGGYAFRKEGKTGTPRSRYIILHHEIMGKPTIGVVDHINMNRLDNRRENLRVVDRAVNRMNSKMNSDNKSGHRGIFFNGYSWVVSITKNRVSRYFGSYKKIEDAIIARDKVMGELR